MAKPDNFEQREGYGCVFLIVAYVFTAIGLVEGLLNRLESGTPLHTIATLAVLIAPLLLWVAIARWLLKQPSVRGWLGYGIRGNGGAQPSVLVRSYSTGFGGAGKKGREQYEREARELAAQGYEPVQSAASEKASAFGVKVGEMTVTYRRREPRIAAKQPDERPKADDLTSKPAPDTKICPDCAETVQAAARICRYCRHEFAETAIPPSRRLREEPDTPDRD